MVRLSKTSNMVSKRRKNFILKRWYVHVVEKFKQYKKVLVHAVNESFLFLASSALDVTTLTSFLCSLPEIFCVCVYTSFISFLNKQKQTINTVLKDLEIIILSEVSHAEKDIYHMISLTSVSSVAQLCPTLCNPMDCSTPGFPVHHQLPELALTHIHQVGDAIQPFHPLLSPSPPAFSLSQHQDLFK